MNKDLIKFLFLILCSMQGYSQNTKSNFNDMYPRAYWGISIVPALVAKSKIVGDPRKYNLNSSPQFGAEVIVSYYYNFEKSYSLVFGIGGGTMAHSFEYNIPKEMFDPPTGSDISANKGLAREWELIYFRLPVELERRWKYKQNSNWNLAGGFSLLFSSQITEDIVHSIILYNGQTQDYLTITKDNINRWKPRLNLHISAGHDWVLRSKNIFRIDLKINYSLSKFATGVYRFNVGNQPELNGQYKVSGSYAGMCISYLFSGNKRW